MEKKSNVKPNTILFSAVINAWVKTRACASALAAQKVLDRMEKLQIQVNKDF